MPEISNMLLDSLSATDAAAIRHHLKPVHLKSKQILFEAGGHVKAVYFPTGAVISLVIGLSSGATVEGAMSAGTVVVGAGSGLIPRRNILIPHFVFEGPIPVYAFLGSWLRILSVS